MSVQDVLNDFGGKVAGLEAADTVVGTREVELNDAEQALDNSVTVQYDAKVAAKLSFDVVLAEVAKLGLDTVVVPPVVPPVVEGE